MVRVYPHVQNDAVVSEIYSVMKILDANFAPNVETKRKKSKVEVIHEGDWFTKHIQRISPLKETWQRRRQ